MSRDWHATYRLQLHAGFPLAAAAQILPYLARLGVSHVYLSPCLQATPGSTHGYDVTDPMRISDDLGGPEAWREFGEAARQLGLGILLDIVPNHMATAHNPWWDDLLMHGPNSRYARFFDVAPAAGGERWRLHLATLGLSYEEALEKGELQIAVDGPKPRLRGNGQDWPLRPASWGLLLPEAARDEFGRLAALYPGGTRPPAGFSGRSQSGSGTFADVSSERVGHPENPSGGRVPPFESDYAAAVAAAEKIWTTNEVAAVGPIAEINRDPARLHAVLEVQHYALHFWRREGEVVNYRRFFDVGSLVALRMEDPAVFAAAHERIVAMVGEGGIDGLRIDHPDGLRDPRGYCRRLRELVPRGRIYVEKILENDERLRPDWPVEGTVGYDFLGKVNRLWMDEQKSDALSGIYADFTGHTVNLPRVVRQTKTHILAEHFPSDLDRLAGHAVALARASWHTWDLSPAHLRAALGLLTVELSVYRTYRDDRAADPFDRAVLTRAFAMARSQAEGIEPRVFEFLEQVFLADSPGPAAGELIARWQQLTPAVTAKGVEDTTFYCYDRLVSCNEVGAQASLLGISSDKFHEFCHHLAESWPDTLLATSTHDTKRSEDVRARISVLTEDTERWGAALREWAAMNLPAWGGREPDRHVEYLLYQTLVGAWPLPQDRAWAYLLKASREAKINTSWRTPNAAYELAIQRFVEGIYASKEFQASLEAFVQPLILPGQINSLAQTLIKLTAPGVPDFYQGSELWDLSLVDPDNRRPVDFGMRANLLEDLMGGTRPPAGFSGFAPSLTVPFPRGSSEMFVRPENLAGGQVPPLDPADPGRAKLWLIARGLALRRAYARCFVRGSAYQPVVAQGSRLGHVFGFMRGGEVLTLVPRFYHTLRGDWGNTLIPLPPGRWKNWLSGVVLEGDVLPAELFKDFPVAAMTMQRPET
jgi:(1->4)-alpha-D-glucan 1-alpha-D-glucosylmutase